VKIVIAVDSFKGSLSSSEAGEALSRGLGAASAAFETVVVAIADGGEGTIEAVERARRGERMELETTDPLGRPVKASYLLLPETKTAVVELAQASGLPLLRDEERDPMKATTVGTGVLIRDAIARGARRVVLAVGGSATNDGGTGLSEALGVRFLDSAGARVSPTGEGLLSIRKISLEEVSREVLDTEFILATDVRNPLTGPTGAAHVYGPQKGAS